MNILFIRDAQHPQGLNWLKGWDGEEDTAGALLFWDW
jgi:hypothetical protein